MSSIEEKKSLPPVPAHLHANNIKSWLVVKYEEVLSALDYAHSTHKDGDAKPFAFTVELCRGTYLSTRSSDIELIREKLREAKYSTELCYYVVTGTDNYGMTEYYPDTEEYRQYFLKITKLVTPVVHQVRVST